MGTNNSQETKATLILGGTGKTGRRVVERLAARGLPVRVGSRSGEPPFDWGDEATWVPALRDVESVYVSYNPDLAVPGAVAVVRSFAKLAARSGVQRLVLLSGRGEPEAERAERVVQEAGVQWTILRSTWFMQNFSEDYRLEHVLSGEIRLPAGDVPTPFLDADDIADVAVAALTEEGHAGQPPPASGTANDERSIVHSDGFDRPRVRAHCWRLLRLLQFCYACAEAVAAGTRHRRDAVDQQAGRHPCLHDGAVRDSCGVPRDGRVGRDLLE